jgi:ATP-dependent Clp protease ATP-binding subunit ClpC
MESQMNESERFDKFTERARKVLSLAHEEAYGLNHDYIGTEHLLLGLVREGEGIAAGALFRAGVDLATVRIQTIQVLKQSAEPDSETQPDGEIED